MTLDPTATIGTTVQPIQTRKSEINSELELLKSRGLAEAVVRHLTPRRVLGQEVAASAEAQATAPDEAAEADRFADAVLKVMDEVKAEAVPDSNVLCVSYGASDPFRARDVVEAYVGEYLDLRLKVYRNPDSQGFFAEQHARSLAELDGLQQRIRAIKDETGLADLATQRTILLQRIGDLKKNGDDARTALAAANATVGQLRGRLNEMPESVVTSRTMNAPNSSVEALRQKLAELRIEERDVSSRYVESSPTVQTIRAKVREAESMLVEAEKRSQETFGLNANREAIALRLETARSDVAANEARVRRVEADLADAEGGLGLLNKTQVTLDDLQRQAAVSQNNVAQYAKVLEEARIDTALEAGKITNISLYQPAKLPLEPVGPKRKLLLVVGWLLAGLSAGGAAFALEALDHTVKRPEDLRLVGARSDNVVSIPRLTSGSAVARSPGDYFDDFRGGLRHVLGTAGRGTTRRAGGAGVGLVRAFLAVGELTLWPLLALRRAVGRTPWMAFLRDVTALARWRSLRMVGRTDWGRVPTWRNLDEWRHAHSQSRRPHAGGFRGTLYWTTPTTSPSTAAVTIWAGGASSRSTRRCKTWTTTRRPTWSPRPPRCRGGRALHAGAGPLRLRAATWPPGAGVTRGRTCN